MLCLKCSIYTEVLSAIPQWKDRQVLFRELSLPHLAFCLPCPPPPLLLTFSMFVWLAGSKSVSFLYHATIYLYIFIIFNSCNFHDTLILGALWITNFIKLIVSQCRTIHKVILNPREFSQDSDSCSEYFCLRRCVCYWAGKDLHLLYFSDWFYSYLCHLVDWSHVSWLVSL